jgi:ubiquinone/menaquinone biosynthesis C-methylase UbiE
VVQDRSNQEELTRLHIQDQMVTAGMGGVLPEQPDPMLFGRVLDVGCGTGDWLIEAAKTYPTMSRLVGVDISGKMLDYARVQADAQQESHRVEFAVMDALRLLEFPNDSFDLVNARLAWSYLRTWDWPKFLSEFQRVCRRGGVIRITESDIYESNSPALTRLSEMFLQSLFQAGHFFAPNRRGVIDEIAPLLRRHGLQRIQTRIHTLHYRAGTPEGQHFAENVQLGYRTVVPFLRRRMRVPDDYEAIYQQMLHEVQQPDFVATWTMLTAWGEVAAKDETPTPLSRDR